MSQTRIEALKVIAEAQPDEPMVWYGLANEFAKLEKWEEATDALRRVVRLRLSDNFQSFYSCLRHFDFSCPLTES